jgi:hypothetical protein
MPSYGYRTQRTPYGSRPATSSNSGYRTGSSTGGSSTGRSSGKSSNPLIGKRVRHPKYGIGTIIEVEGEDEERRLTVSFQDHGAKKLIERYANLSLA